MFEHLQLPHPTIFAHRGSSAHAPENTLAAFSLAVRQQCDALELDVKLSSDEQVVVIHDASVDRTTDGSGLVNDLPLAALKELDAGCKFDEAFCGERIPTLAEVFEALGQETIINIELTNYRAPRNQLPEKVADLIKHYNLGRRVFFSSFNPMALHRISRLLPQIPIGLLAMAGLGGVWARSPLGDILHPQALHPAIADATEHLIQRQHRKGRRVHVYTVNHPQDMAALFRWDVDGIFTDDPILARRTLEAETRAEAAT